MKDYSFLILISISIGLQKNYSDKQSLINQHYYLDIFLHEIHLKNLI